MGGIYSATLRGWYGYITFVSSWTNIEIARAQYSKDYPAYTFDMDSLVLQPVPDPQGAFPWARYCSCLGAPGLTAFIGLEHVADAKAVRPNLNPAILWI
jgi:NADPH-dependent curcumin reductase CurA